jgi:hypothetical protein
MIFLATPNDGSGGTAANDPNATDPNAATAAQPLDYKATLLALLGLDATADDSAIQAKADEVTGTLGTVGDLQTKASSADDLQRQLDELRPQYEELNRKQEEIYRQQQEAQADEILATYKDRFVDEASMAPIRNILITDKQAGIAILNGLKKPEAAAPAEQKVEGQPPAPKHDPTGAAQPTAEEKAAEAETLIATIQKEGKFKDYTSAREEARRRKPELFS